jgi:membrane carboxypeptidase/penicillin-binding protein PbpC
MPAIKIDQFEKRCQQVYSDYVETKKQELSKDIALDRFKALKDLSDELGYKYISIAEHAALLAKATKQEEDVKKDVDAQVQTKLEALQRQLDHELEKQALKHAVDIARLEEEVKHLRASLPGDNDTEPAVASEPVQAAQG